MLRRLSLPGGLDVFSLNPNETRFVHGEVFGARCYLQYGIKLRDGDCVFDVGANIGLATVFFHRERRNVRILAFEPNPAACECLKANVDLHEVDARVFECGLSCQSGSAEFTFYPANSVMSGFHADLETDRRATKAFMVNGGLAPERAERLLPFLFKKEMFPCPLRTLSEIIDEQGVERIDLLKVDVEKSEWEVLAGVRPEHWGRVRQAVVEVHNERGEMDAIRDLFEQHGFHVTAVQDSMLRGTTIFTVFASREDRRGE